MRTVQEQVDLLTQLRAQDAFEYFKEEIAKVQEIKRLDHNHASRCGNAIGSAYSVGYIEALDRVLGLCAELIESKSKPLPKETIVDRTIREAKSIQHKLVEAFK